MSLIKDISVKVFSNYSDDTTHLNTEDRKKAEGYKTINEIFRNYSRRDQGEFIMHLLHEFTHDRETVKGSDWWADIIFNLEKEIAEKNYEATIRINSTIIVKSNEPFKDEEDFIDNIYDAGAEDLIQGEAYLLDVISHDPEIDEVYHVTSVD